MSEDLITLVTRISNNFTKILSKDEIQNNKQLKWGNNGIGDRWANKKFNYTVIYSNKKTKTYSENENDIIELSTLNDFIENNNGRHNGIIGIFVHSIRQNIVNRPIKIDIKKEITSQSCVICGSNTDIVCDHKNDLYNDEKILSKTQLITDFQPLCNHCNLQKRQICKEEKRTNKLYSAKQISIYKIYPFEFPWEKKNFDLNLIDCKTDTFWYDPIEFNRKLLLYIQYLPSIKAIKLKKHNILKNNI